MGWWAKRKGQGTNRSNGSVAVPSRQRVRDLLEETPFGFLNSSLGDNAKKWKRFCKNFEFESHAENTEILSHTQVSRALYIILDGEVSISFPDETDSSKRALLCTKTRGDIFGTSRFTSLSPDDAADAETDDDGEVSESKDDNADLSGAAVAAAGTIGDERAAGVTVTVISSECSLVRLNDIALTRYLQKYPSERESLEKILSFSAADSLREVPWLQGIDERHLVYLAHMLHYHILKPEERLFDEGSLGRAMFFVSHGRVRACTYDAKEEHEKVLREFNPGDNFGEISFACNMPRTSDIVASEPSLVLKLEKDDCDRFFQLFSINRGPWVDMLKSRTAESFRRYKVPFFESITDDQYEILASLCSIERFQPGTVIFREGDAGDTFYIVAHGDLEATVVHDDKKLVLGNIRPGQYFGEIALVSNQVRSATVTTTSRCVLLKITKTQFDQFFEKAPEALSDFQMKLSGYHVELKVLLFHRDGVKYFEDHLKKEYSEENIRFWKACRKFEQMNPDEQKELAEEAQHISRKFIEDDADEQVNLPETVKARVLADIATCKIDLHTFDKARDEILHLMSADSFQRFKQSTLFQDLLAVIGDMSYKTKEGAIRSSVDSREHANHSRTNSSSTSRRQSLMPNRGTFGDFRLHRLSRSIQSEKSSSKGAPGATPHSLSASASHSLGGR